VVGIAVSLPLAVRRCCGHVASDSDAIIIVSTNSEGMRMPLKLKRQMQMSQ
jgi:hypothetical protein